MGDTITECNLDLVIEMEEMGIAVEEILQYARGILERDDVRSLVYGLEKQLAAPTEVQEVVTF